MDTTATTGISDGIRLRLANCDLRRPIVHTIYHYSVIISFV